MSDPFIPRDVLEEAIGTALHESVVASFTKTAAWGSEPPSPWYVRLRRRLARYIPHARFWFGSEPPCSQCAGGW